MYYNFKNTYEKYVKEIESIFHILIMIFFI